MGDKHAPSPVEALASEKPATLMAQLRAIWPDVERAVQVGHTLRVIHRRMNQMGIPISYRRLTVYRSRLRREKEKNARTQSQAHSVIASNPGGPESDPKHASKTFDPLFNLREREKKRVVWRYPTGPPDESKLF